MTLLDRVKELCKERGTNLKQVGDAVGIGNGVIGKWDQSSPTVENLGKIADYFNVSLDYLVGRTEVRDVILGSHQINKSKIQELEKVIETLLNEIDSGEITIANQSVTNELSQIIKKMLLSDLEVWQLMNCQENKELREVKQNVKTEIN